MLEEMKAAEAGQTIWDKGDRASVRGLHLRVAKNGAKSFYLFYRTRGGQQRRFKLGLLGGITLVEARKRATLILSRVSVGEDPKAEWNTSKAEMTVAELFEATVQGHWIPKAQGGSTWAEKDVHNFYKNQLSGPFGALRLSEVTPLRVREWHKRFERQSTYAGNRALQVLSRMFNFAEEQELRAQHTNPCRLVKAHPEKKRKRYATIEEVQRIARILEREAFKHPVPVAFLYLLMFSGSRPIAIERATWDQLKEFEVNGEKYGVLTFDGKSSGKTGQDEEVVLPPQAMRAISWLPRVPGRTITGMQMPRKLWNRVRKEAGCEDLWARDWRRTFATVGMSGGVNSGTIGELLNHHSSETTKIYAKVITDRKVEVASTIAGNIEKIMRAKAG